MRVAAVTRPAIRQRPSQRAGSKLQPRMGFNQPVRLGVAPPSTGFGMGSWLGSSGSSSYSSTSTQSVPDSAAGWFINGLTSLPLSVVIPAAVAATTGLAYLAAVIDAKLKTAKPEVQLPQGVPQAAEFHSRVLERCPSIMQPYKPTPFLTNGHVETIFAAKLRSAPHVAYARECLRMPDGGTVALDWPMLGPLSNVAARVGNSPLGQPLELPPLTGDAPVLILLPGLTGGSGDSYILHAVARAAQRGIRAVVFNSRGTSDSPVTTPQYYSASFTGDMRAVVAHVAAKFPHAPLLAAGWSLGANILVRYLGEEGAATPLRAAVSMCNPFELTISNHSLTVGFNRVYDLNLAASLKRIFSKHELMWNSAAQPGVRPDKARAAKTIREFDDAITIRCFGWPSVDAYYAGSSSSLSVPRVAIPLLALQALDDPIAPKEAIPYKALAANPNCVLVTTRFGGHLGWVSGDGAPLGHPWSDQAMLEWLDSVLLEIRGGSGNNGQRRSADVVLAGASSGTSAQGASPFAYAGVPGGVLDTHRVAAWVATHAHASQPVPPRAASQRSPFVTVPEEEMLNGEVASCDRQRNSYEFVAVASNAVTAADVAVAADLAGASSSGNCQPEQATHAQASQPAASSSSLFRSLSATAQKVFSRAPSGGLSQLSQPPTSAATAGMAATVTAAVSAPVTATAATAQEPVILPPLGIPPPSSVFSPVTSGFPAPVVGFQPPVGGFALPAGGFSQSNAVYTFPARAPSEASLASLVAPSEAAAAAAVTAGALSPSQPGPSQPRQSGGPRSTVGSVVGSTISRMSRRVSAAPEVAAHMDNLRFGL